MKHILIISIISILFSSCNGGGILGGTSLGGKPGELLVVITDKYKNSEVSVDVSSILNQYEIGLTQSEPPFNLLTISQNHFSSVFRPHRNILYLDINKKYTKPKVEFHKNMWTQDQAYVAIGVNNPNSLLTTLSKYHKSIIDFYIEAEIKRYQISYRSFINRAAQKTIKDTFGILVDVTTDYRVNKVAKDFIWLSAERAESSQGLIIYSRDYTNKEQLEKVHLLAYRDSITQTHIPGPSDGSYMTTEYILPIQRKIGRYINDDYTIELRGKWRVKNDFMAGPFSSYTFVDKKSQKLITIEGYVYYPNKNKRNLMRQLQAICRSARAFDKKEDTNE